MLCPPPLAPEMPPPPWPSDSMAARFATHWAVEAVAGAESYDFSVLQALLKASSEHLVGAPEATRERVALRSLQKLASLIPAGGDAAATAGVLKVDGARSCEDALSRLIKEVEISGKLEKDLLPPFSQDIQETIRAKKFTLPETSFQLLEGVDPLITSVTPTSQLEHNDTEHCANDQTLHSSHEYVTIEKPLFPTDNAEVQQDTMTNLVNESETGNLRKDPLAPTCVLHQPCMPESSPYVPLEEDTADAVGLGARSPGRSPIVEGNISFGSVLASTGNQALHEDGSIMKNNTTHGGLTAQTAPVSQNCNVTLHDKTPEANCSPEQKNEENGTDAQKDNCRTSIPSSSDDRDRGSAKKTSNEEKSEDTSPEISARSKDQDIDDTLEGLSQQDLCIKCGKDGELLTCSDCSLAAHGRCFGSSVTFEGTDLFYCPVCSCEKASKDYLKAQKRYFEAKKYATAFIATAQVSKQHVEQLNGVQPGAAKRDGHSYGSDMSKRNSINQNEAYDLAHRDEEPHQLRKKQKVNPKEVLTEKAPSPRNSGPAPMNKHSVLQNNSKTRVEGPEKKQQAGDKEVRKEAGTPRKRSSVHPQKRYSNPVAPPGRRASLVWTAEEEAMLREAMARFTPQDDAPIPWVRILEYGRHVFNKTRLPSDLRVKWRNLNMKRKTDAGK